MKVYIEEGNMQYDNMMKRNGYEICWHENNADLVLFTGGIDVCPMMYGKLPHRSVDFSKRRDASCVRLWTHCRENNIPMAGICRGAQFLHVMNGGELVQDCDEHLGTHTCKVAWMPGDVKVSSTHHQMMFSHKVGDVLMWTDRSTVKWTTDNNGYEKKLKTGYDIEAMYYPQSKSMSFQPHPEFYNPSRFQFADNGLKQCEEAFFFILNNYVMENK